MNVNNIFIIFLVIIIIYYTINMNKNNLENYYDYQLNNPIDSSSSELPFSSHPAMRNRSLRSFIC